MKIYQLNKALQYNGRWYPTGGSIGRLYQTLAGAQAQVQGAGEWRQRPRRRQWETDHMDIITEIKVIACAPERTKS